MKPVINLEAAERILKVVDAGLSSGLGRATPGFMCVEAAVCYGLGLPHGDNPQCVHEAVRSFKINLNDANWSSKAARAKGLRRLSIAQLGTDDKDFDAKLFARELSIQTVRQILPITLRGLTRFKCLESHKKALESAALACEAVTDPEAADSAARAAYSAADRAADSAARAAYSAADSAANGARNAASAARNAASAARNAANSAARNKVLGLMAEIGVQALRLAGAAGIKLMDKLC